jgi:hypothetical protein
VSRAAILFVGRINPERPPSLRVSVPEICDGTGLIARAADPQPRPNVATKPTCVGCPCSRQEVTTELKHVAILIFRLPFVILCLTIFIWQFECMMPLLSSLRGTLRQYFKGFDRMKRIVLVVSAAIGLAACSGQVKGGSSDVATTLPGTPHVTHPTGPYDNTANSLGGPWVGGGDG